MSVASFDIREALRDRARERRVEIMDRSGLSNEEASVMATLDVATAEIIALTKRAEAAEAECDALRKDAARLDYLDTVRHPYSRRPMREVIGTEWSIVFTHPATHTPTIREALDAALAVQPTTGEAK